MVLGSFPKSRCHKKYLVISFWKLNIFGRVFIDNILSIKEITKGLFLVVFNRIYYYENWIPCLRVFIKLKRRRDKKSKCYEDF